MVNKNRWGSRTASQLLEETEKVLGLRLDPFIVVHKGEPCRVQGCQTPIYVVERGLCSSHSRTFYLKRRITNESRPVCDVVWCDVPTYAKGKCRVHYNSVRMGREIKQPTVSIPKGTPCLVDDCDIPSVSVGMCTTHGKQYRKGQTFTKVKPRNKPIIIDNQRECTRCHEWKTLDQFYLRKHSDGNYHPAARCKRCFIELQAQYSKK